VYVTFNLLGLFVTEQGVWHRREKKYYHTLPYRVLNGYTALWSTLYTAFYPST